MLSTKLVSYTKDKSVCRSRQLKAVAVVVVVVALLFYVHGKHLRSCRDGQLT